MVTIIWSALSLHDLEDIADYQNINILTVHHSARDLKKRGILPFHDE